MGKLTTSGKAPYPPPENRSRQTVLLAIIAGVLLLAIVVLALIMGGRSNAPLPANPVDTASLPLAPPLPDVRQQNLPATTPPLPETRVQAPPQEPVTEVRTPEPEPEPSGTITWKWLLYPVNPTVLGISVGRLMPGYQFVALGVTIVNRSTVPVDVDNNAFTITVDGRTYVSEVWSTGHAVIQGMPFLAAATLEPGGSMSGFTGYMIPLQIRRAVANWRPLVPPTVKVERVDPPSPMSGPPAPAPSPSASPFADE
jgi:hypothetical protein